MNADEFLMHRCIELAQESLRIGDLPFGALLTRGGDVVAEAVNTGLKDITGHAEINVIKKALENDPEIDFSQCSLYTNFEPCAMCSFVIRDYGIGRVVFGAPSPHLGGFSKWDILKNSPLPAEFTSRAYASPPEIVPCVLSDEARAIFDRLDWRMHK